MTWGSHGGDWIVAPCRLVWVYRRFRGLYCHHHQGVWSCFTRHHQKGAISSVMSLITCFTDIHELRRVLMRSVIESEGSEGRTVRCLYTTSSKEFWILCDNAFPIRMNLQIFSQPCFKEDINEREGTDSIFSLDCRVLCCICDNRYCYLSRRFDLYRVIDFIVQRLS
jgi:hypothetical protein